MPSGVQEQYDLQVEQLTCCLADTMVYSEEVYNECIKFYLQK